MKLQLKIITNMPDHDANKFLGMKLMVSSLLSEQIKERSQQEKAKDEHPLSDGDKWDSIDDAYNSLIDIVKLFFLLGLECVHCRMNWFMASSKLKYYIRFIQCQPWETQCFLCTGEYKTICCQLYTRVLLHV